MIGGCLIALVLAQAAKTHLQHWHTPSAHYTHLILRSVPMSPNAPQIHRQESLLVLLMSDASLWIWVAQVILT